MLVQFKRDTPHTKREGGTKNFLKGLQYTIDNSYAKELIEVDACFEVVEITDEDLKPKKKKSNQ